LYSTGSGGVTALPTGRNGFAFFAAAARLLTFFALRDERFAAERKVARRAADRLVRVAAIVLLSTGPFCHHRPISSRLCCWFDLFLSVLLPTTPA
jgi:hypothetical protein